jgi:hypothetical protein
MWAGGEGFLLNCGMKLEHIAGVVFIVVGIAALRSPGERVSHLASLGSKF